MITIFDVLELGARSQADSRHYIYVIVVKAGAKMKVLFVTLRGRVAYFETSGRTP